jgi:hypothetical protein
MYDGTDLTGVWLTVASGGSQSAHVAADFYEGGTVGRITQWFLPFGRWYSNEAGPRRDHPLLVTHSQSPVLGHTGDSLSQGPRW